MSRLFEIFTRKIELEKIVIFFGWLWDYLNVMDDSEKKKKDSLQKDYTPASHS